MDSSVSRERRSLVSARVTSHFNWPLPQPPPPLSVGGVFFRNALTHVPPYKPRMVCRAKSCKSWTERTNAVYVLLQGRFSFRKQTQQVRKCTLKIQLWCCRDLGCQSLTSVLELSLFRSRANPCAVFGGRSVTATLFSKYFGFPL